VAAPTAGLHFTLEMLREIADLGIPSRQLTLHVGAGTFVPIKHKNARDHRMHGEKVHVSLGFLEYLIGHTNGLIAVGTTSTRSLETLYWLGVKAHEGKLEIRTGPGNAKGAEENSFLEFRQWENEALPQDLPLELSLRALYSWCTGQQLEQLRFTTGLMISPGYRFRTISGLVTNFHQPGSTLLLLIAALIGEDWKKVYARALENGYRFLSYGDSSLLLPGRNV